MTKKNKRGKKREEFYPIEKRNQIVKQKERKLALDKMEVQYAKLSVENLKLMNRAQLLENHILELRLWLARPKSKEEIEYVV